MRSARNGHFMIPVDISDDGRTFTFKTVDTSDGQTWHAVFTTRAEYEKGPESQILSNFIDTTLQGLLDTGNPGCVINPWGESFILTRDLIQMMFIAEKDVKEEIQ